MSSALDREPWLSVLENIAETLGPKGQARDAEDVLFLAGKHRPDPAAVRAVAETFANPGRRQALENLVYLRITDLDDR